MGGAGLGAPCKSGVSCAGTSTGTSTGGTNRSHSQRASASSASASRPRGSRSAHKRSGRPRHGLGVAQELGDLGQRSGAPVVGASCGDGAGRAARTAGMRGALQAFAIAVRSGVRSDPGNSGASGSRSSRGPSTASSASASRSSGKSTQQRSSCLLERPARAGRVGDARRGRRRVTVVDASRREGRTSRDRAAAAGTRGRPSA